MKKHTLVDNYNKWVYDDTLRNEYYKEYCEDNEMEFNEDNSFDWALEQAQMYEEDAWDNLRYLKTLNGKATMVGAESKYHLWDGFHEVYDKKIDNLLDFLQNILFDYDKTYEVSLIDGKIHVTWSDHDSPCGGTELVFRKTGGRYTLADCGLA